MNFPSSSNCFCIKNTFTNSFIHFKQVLDWAQDNQRTQGPRGKIPKTQRTSARTAGWFWKSGGSLVLFYHDEGVRSHLSHWILFQPPKSDTAVISR
jgi:hypothetical protein